MSPSLFNFFEIVKEENIIYDLFFPLKKCEVHDISMKNCQKKENKISGYVPLSSFSVIFR